MSIEAVRADPTAIENLGIEEIVDHYDAIIRALDSPPIIIGHSFGGAFTEILLDRGLGAAGVEFPGRSHFIIGQEGWEEVADYALRWAMEQAAAPAMA